MTMTKKTMLWTIGSIATAGIGLAMKSVNKRRKTAADAAFLQHEIEVLEGEGGICLS